MVKSIKKSKNIYMDYASGASANPANPGAIHDFGVKAKKQLNEVREEIAKILGAHSNEVVFTSGATESNNLALLGVINKFYESFFQMHTYLPAGKLLCSARQPAQGISKNTRKIIPHIITTNIEHASVLEVCKHLEKTKQIEVTYVPVEENGIVDPEKIKKALKSNTILVSVMYANNEIGTIQPIREIAKEIRHYRKNKVAKRSDLKNLERSDLGIFPVFHTDATQAINYLSINVEKLGVDLFSFNGSKIYGPSGVGVLYIKRMTPITNIIFGGDQEFGLRPGTENIVGIVGLAKALKTVEQIKDKEVKRLIKLRDYFIKKMSRLSLDTTHFQKPGLGDFPLNLVSGKVILNGDLKNRLPNNINITIPKIPSDLLVIELSAHGIMASVKSACKSGDEKASHVIQAIREAQLGELLVNKEIDGSIRFSLGRQTTKADIDYTLKALSQILTKLKKWYN
ncbi:MAG: cysteine desulfurase family protein [Minisyncoccia bacterium]